MTGTGAEDNQHVVPDIAATTPATGSARSPVVLSPAGAETLQLLRSGADHPLVQSFAAGAMLIFDHDLRYLCAGGLALADVGLSTAMMEGKTIFEVFEPDFIAVIEPQYRLALSGVESVIDLHYAGNVYSQRLAPVRDPDGAIVAGMGYTQDVTQARRSESALRESEEHSRLALEHLAEERRRLSDAEEVGLLGSWEHDVVAQTVVWSDNLFRLYGMNPATFTGDVAAALQCVHPDDRDDVEAGISAAALDGEPFVMRYRVVREDDGALRWCDTRGHGLYEDGHLMRVGGVVSDVTESVLAAAEATAAHAMQQAVISTSPDIIFVYDIPSRSVIWTNRSLTELLGYDIPDARAFGVDPVDFMIPDSDRAAFDRALAQAIDAADGEVISLDHRMRHADGSIRWFSRRTTVLNRSELGVVTQLVGVARDITDAMAIEQRLHHSARHDELTGLPNRALLTERLSNAIARCQHSGGELAVLFCDLDGFKRVNDISGHAAGDFVLIQTAARLLSAVRDTDVVARVGGDEFVIVIDPGSYGRAGHPRPGNSGEYDLDLAVRICERIISAVRQPIMFNGVEHVVSASIGLSYGTPVRDDQLSVSTPEQVLQDADAAMYKAKSRGKDRYQIFEQAMRSDVVERGRVEHVLRWALRRAAAASGSSGSEYTGGESSIKAGSDPDAPMFTAAYQPIFDAGTGALVGFEALARLTDAGGIGIPPDVFIAIAEDTGLIQPLGRVMLHLACHQLADWRANFAGMDEVTMAVNVSGIQAQEGSLGDDVRRVLGDYRLASQDLVLELTETALLQAAPATITGLQILRDEGVGIAIDDFGTGYASLRYLATLPVSKLKIDKSFTAGLPHDKTSTKIVFAVAGLAADLNLGCVVEGVETEQQRSALPEGVHLQGWLTGRPQPAQAVDVAALVDHAQRGDLVR